MPALTPNQKRAVRTAMRQFTELAEKNEAVWHYSQQRPFSGFGAAPWDRHVNDCSGYVSLVYNHAMHKTGCYLADPIGYRYSGYGYTGSMVEWLEAHGKQITNGSYWVGDIAITGRTRQTTDHTFVCRRNGDTVSSVWSSHGNEHAPNRVTLNYHPTPLLGVWRHPALL